MGWSVGYDDKWQRDIGYGVPATCDHPGCNSKIDRGLSYVCCGEEPYGGEHGCGLYFCFTHRVSHYTDNHANAILAELIESLMVAGISKDDAIDLVLDEYPLMCQRCATGAQPFEASPDVEEWIDHKNTHESWADWRHKRDIGES